MDNLETHFANQYDKQASKYDGHVSINLRASKGAPAYFTRSIEKHLANGTRLFKVRLTNDSHGFFPNTMVPIAGAIAYYATNKGCTFLPSRSIGPSTYPGKAGLLCPYENPGDIRDDQYLDKIWMFTEETHSAIVQGIVSSLRQNISLEKGVLNSLELCLNEVSDNVLVHSSKMDESENPYGLMMAQIHKNTQRIVAVVYDNGIGIPSSLRTSGINCIDGNDAIAHAMQKGVTDGNGAGNGLWILDSIVRQNQGSFEITSDGVRYSLRHSQKHSKAEESFSKASSAIPGTTLVDFQLDISNNIDLNEIIGGPGYIDLWAENHEDEANENNMRLKLREEANGFGSRYDAARMRNLVINTANMTEGLVILDFCDVEAVSMSFADELIRKLSDEVGFVSFSNKIRFSGLNSECQSIIDAVMRKSS